MFLEINMCDFQIRSSPFMEITVSSMMKTFEFNITLFKYYTDLFENTIHNITFLGNCTCYVTNESMKRFDTYRSITAVMYGAHYFPCSKLQ